jgi:hypothetical protein
MKERDLIARPCDSTTACLVEGSEQLKRLAWLEMGKCPLHGEAMSHVGYVNAEKTLYLAECDNPDCRVQASTVCAAGTHMTLTTPFMHLVEPRIELVKLPLHAKETSSRGVSEQDQDVSMSTD